MLTDINVINYCNENKRISWDKRDINIVNYLLNRFNDFSVDNIYDKCRESLYRLKHNLNKCPTCQICGNKLKYLPKYKFYESACSKICKKELANIKLQETSLKLYGTNRPSQNNKVKNKQKETNIKKYGYPSPLISSDIKIKAKETLINKYGEDNITKTKYWKNSVNKTSLIKYGTLYPNQNVNVKNKMKQTCLEHFGVDNFFKTQIAKEHANSKEAINKMIQTKRKNHTFNTSKIEIDSYNILKTKYPDVIYQYKDKNRYPFVCDFYIPSKDLFIECNYHWTHGGHPYDSNNIKDINKIKIWKSKNKQYYNNAINCWTIRDVNKRNIAKNNKLNYIEIWKIEELNNI